MFWQNGGIHPEKRRKRGEVRNAIHAGPWGILATVGRGGMSRLSGILGH